MSERWQRRERKRLKKRNALKESGRGLKTVILPIIEKKAQEAKEKDSKA